MNFLSGIFHLATPKPVDPARLQTMAGGGANGNIWTAPGIGLCASKGADIALCADSGMAILFYGKIYNFNEIIRNININNEHEAKLSDALLVLRGWQRWGRAVLDHIEGKFAFALYEMEHHRLTLARDRFGSCALHSAQISDGSLIFSSTMRGLAAHPLFRKRIAPTAIDDYLALGFIPDDNCLLAGIQKLPPAHYAVITRGKAPSTPICWWDIQFRPGPARSDRALDDEWTARMRAAVTIRTETAHMGALLTHLPEDAALIAFMAENSASAVPSCTFDQGWDDAGNIGDAGDAISRRFATRHMRHGVFADSLLSLLDDFTQLFDEPIASITPMVEHAQYLRARQQMAGLMAPIGSDEFFCGHPEYRPFGAFEMLRRSLDKNHDNKDLYPVLSFLKKRRSHPFLDQRTSLSVGLRAPLLTARMRKDIEGYSPIRRYAAALERAFADDNPARAQYADIHIRLPTMVQRAEISAQAAGLELHNPFLDRELAQFAASLPLSQRFRKGRGKWMMRRALRPFLSKDILWNSSAPTPPPVGEWFRTILKEHLSKLANASALVDSGFFSPSALASLAEEHRSGHQDHGALFWQLLMLDRSIAQLQR